MQVSLKVSGGYSGLRLPAQVVDTEMLGPNDRTELAGLVARAEAEGSAAAGPATRTPDARSFVVEVNDDGTEAVLHGSERAMGPALTDLVDWLREHGG